LKLIERFVPDHEAIAGDLIEDFARHRSRFWFWRQAIAAVAIARTTRPAEIRPLLLVDEPSAPPTEPRAGRRMTAPVGVVGLLAIVLLIARAAPAAWWVIAFAMGAGLVVGGAMIVARGRGAATRPHP